MKYAVIGAGLAGLVAARELSVAHPDATVDVYEADDRIGGKLFTVAYDCGPVDVGAEAFLAMRKDAADYFRELGIADTIVHPSGLGSLIYSGGKLHPMPYHTVMGVPAAAAFLGDLIGEDTAERIDHESDAGSIDWAPGGDAPIGRLVRKRFGDDVVDHVVCAFLGGVYSCPADELSLRATVPQLARALDELAEKREQDPSVAVTLTAAVKLIDERRNSSPSNQKHTTAATTPIFGSFEGGYKVLYEALADQVSGDIMLDSFITGVTKTDDGFVVAGAGNRPAYDGVVIATPAPTAALLLAQLNPQASEIASRVNLASSVVVGMKFASSEGLPNNSGVLVAADEGLHAKAFTFSSRKWPHLARYGGALVRCSMGHMGDTTALDADEDTIVDWALDDLRTVSGFDGRAAGLDEIFVQKWYGGIPHYAPGHVELVDSFDRAISDGVDGLAVAGAWRHGVGVPAVIADARKAAASL